MAENTAAGMILMGMRSTKTLEKKNADDDEEESPYPAKKDKIVFQY